MRDSSFSGRDVEHRINLVHLPQHYFLITSFKTVSLSKNIQQRWDYSRVFKDQQQHSRNTFQDVILSIFFHTHFWHWHFQGRDTVAQSISLQPVCSCSKVFFVQHTKSISLQTRHCLWWVCGCTSKQNIVILELLEVLAGTPAQTDRSWNWSKSQTHYSSSS